MKNRQLGCLFFCPETTNTDMVKILAKKRIAELEETLNDLLFLAGDIQLTYQV